MYGLLLVDTRKLADKIRSQERAEQARLGRRRFFFPKHTQTHIDEGFKQ